MKKKDVEIGRIYLAKVSGDLVGVRIVDECAYGGWNAVNVRTDRRVRIKTAVRLKRLLGSPSAAAENRAQLSRDTTAQQGDPPQSTMTLEENSRRQCAYRTPGHATCRYAACTRCNPKETV